MCDGTQGFRSEPDGARDLEPRVQSKPADRVSAACACVSKGVGCSIEPLDSMTRTRMITRA